ncbi:cutinase family protein [Hoyosella sp. G463]|uniref:Cutinase family protein n=1 Tax=Lolliginicoccus lacisalsi TaxID=2742202 RepID=A0A927JD22_9ACTN|nr:cutinase family protein [Lolliginicoccus lacisalsi]MBD8506935.1 cutinase family protein [Lolliginicoccus lacisalsi]
MAWASQARSRRKGRSRLPRLLLLLLVVIVVIVIVVALIMALLDRIRIPGMPGMPPTTPTEEAQQREWCPDVQLYSVPGTWESSAGDDPLNPTANPAALLLDVTQPLAAQYPLDRAEIYTVPYPAQFQRPGGPPEMTYDESRAIGKSALSDAMAQRHSDCPLTRYVMMGFSQGAVIAGDIASQIGRGEGPVPPENVSGVALVADGRYDPAAATTIGPPVQGVGLEIALAGLPVIPGATLSGNREGGFGAVAERTVQICAPNDPICDAPRLDNLVLAFNRLVKDYLNNPVHALYGSHVVDEQGTTTTAWLVGWARGIIDDAPVQQHP